MHPPHHFARHTVLAAGIVALCLLCCKESEEEKAQKEQEFQEMVTSLKAVQSTLASNALPEPGPCPKLNAKKHSVTSSSGLMGKLDGSGASKDELEEWAWLNSANLEDIILTESGDQKRLQIGKSSVKFAKEHPYVVVFKGAKKAMPKVSGNSFERGYFHGELIVMERETGKALCRTPLVVEGTASISVKVRGMGSESAKTALDRDFLEAFSDASQAALGKITKDLKISPRALAQ